MIEPPVMPNTTSTPSRTRLSHKICAPLSFMRVLLYSIFQVPFRCRAISELPGTSGTLRCYS
jgi:hypothetical protein